MKKRRGNILQVIITKRLSNYDAVENIIKNRYFRILSATSRYFQVLSSPFPSSVATYLESVIYNLFGKTIKTIMKWSNTSNRA